MYRMEKITTGIAYGASAGSIINGVLNAYSPEQWNAIGVLVGIMIGVLTYLTNLYFKIKDDRRKEREDRINGHVTKFEE
ncbi:class II holin family protein [Kluyvera sp. NPDC087067]|uniref:class II holin family protein n=1 Tax=Kluyvera sp. NPDC087067 TaxID=3364105 RepID=UPI003811DFD5